MESSTPTQPRTRRALVGALWVVLALAVGVLLVRGTWRGMQEDHSRDFALIYSCVLGWVEGFNPYDASQLDDVWREAGGSERYLPTARSRVDNLYPPSTFALLSPLTLLSWSQTHIAWALMNTAMVGVIVWSLLRIAGMRFGSVGGIVLCAAACASAPITTSIAHGQTPLPVVACVVLAHALRIGGWSVIPGVLLGMAAAIKPQIGFVFLAYELFRMRWVIGGTGLAVTGGLAAIGVLRLQIAGVDWLPTLRANLAGFRAPGAVSDPALTGPARSHMTNLHVPLHALIENRTLVAGLVFAIVGAIALVFLVIWLRRREDRRELLTLSMASSLLLLVVYHRSYDAAVLLIPAAWAFDSLRRCSTWRERWPALVTLACAAVFIVPGGAALALLEARGTIPQSLVHTTFYSLFADGHQAIALVVMSGALMVALWRMPKAPAKWAGRDSATAG